MAHTRCPSPPLLLPVLLGAQKEWSLAETFGAVPSPRAGVASVTVGSLWFILGGGDNEGGEDGRETLIAARSSVCLCLQCWLCSERRSVASVSSTPIHSHQIKHCHPTHPLVLRAGVVRVVCESVVCEALSLRQASPCVAPFSCPSIPLLTPQEWRRAWFWRWTH